MSTSLARSPAVLVPLIKQELDAGRDHYREAGKLMLEAKEGLDHGKFKPWIARHFEVSYSSAKGYMRMAAKGHRGVLLRQARSDPATRRKPHRQAAPASDGGAPASAPRSYTAPRTYTPPRDEEKASIREMARDVIDAGHRALARKHHPDISGGSVALMTRLNLARDVLVQCILNW